MSILYLLKAKKGLLTRIAVGNMALFYNDKKILIQVKKEVSLGDWGEGAKCK